MNTTLQKSIMSICRRNCTCIGMTYLLHWTLISARKLVICLSEESVYIAVNPLSWYSNPTLLNTRPWSKLGILLMSLFQRQNPSWLLLMDSNKTIYTWMLKVNNQSLQFTIKPQWLLNHSSIRLFIRIHIHWISRSETTISKVNLKSLTLSISLKMLPPLVL